MTTATTAPLVHPTDCRCPNCNWNGGRADPTPAITDPLERTADYARRIHWWVRLFGVVWLVGLVFGVAFFTTQVVASRGSYATCLKGGGLPSMCEVYRH